jgi:hypothetical protein
MKKFVALFCLLLCATSLVYGQKTRFGQTQVKPNPADYKVKLHISATHIQNNCSYNGNTFICSSILFADAILDGKKIELSGGEVKNKKAAVLILPGDYQAKLTSDNHNTDCTLFMQEYDLLLSDGIVWHCWTSGISE